MELTKYSKVALVCRPGPENGPYTAQYLETLQEGFSRNGPNILGIYAVSGSTPTALLGCIREEKYLCDVWRHLTPADIIGENNRKRLRMLLKLYRLGYAFPNEFLINLLYKHAGKDRLDRIFSAEAILAKIAAVDLITAEQIIFSNRVPEHRKLFILGTAASMSLVPWFPSITIDGAVGHKLIDRNATDFDFVFLADGGYRGGLLLEEAIREPIGYDLIIIVDIHGLNVRKLDLKEDSSYNAAIRIERVVNIISNTNDRLELSLVERVNEGIEIKKMLENLIEEMPVSNPRVQQLKEIVDRMNNGRLRLGDKHAAEIIIAPSPGNYQHFDFTNFTQAEVIRLMQYGHNSALKTLRQLGISTEGLPLIRPSH